MYSIEGLPNAPLVMVQQLLFGEIFGPLIFSLKNSLGSFSFAINPDISVKEIIMAQDLDSIFHLPISGQASQELGDLQDLLLSSDYDLASNDSWSFMWGN